MMIMMKRAAYAAALRTAYAAALLTVFTLAFLALPASVFAEQDHTVSTWSELQETIDRSDAGDVIHIGRTIAPETGDSYIRIPSNKEIVIDLEGNSIDRQLTAAQRSGQVILVEGDLTIIDSSGSDSGTITGGYNEGNGSSTLDNAGGITVKGGSLTLKGGTITGNHTSGSGISGAGVCISSGAKFDMKGGVISRNKSEGYNDGGGVGVGNGTFVMSGGTIEANIASEGGGVHVGYGRFEMKGGAIRENSAEVSGGGVYVHHYNNHETFGFYLSGGSITDNRSDTAGGVYVYTNAEDTYPCPFYLSGSPVIKGNTKQTSSTTEKSNLVLVSAVPFTLTERLEESALIGVTRIATGFDDRPNPEVFAKNLKEYGSTSNFESDNDDFIVGITSGGDGALCLPVQVTFDAGDDRITGETPAMTVPKDGEFQLPENGFDENEDLLFTGWIVGDSDEVLAPGDTVIVSENTTIKAKWHERESIAGAEVVLSDDSFAYNGLVQKPEITVTLGGRPLAEGTDYSVIWPDPEPVDQGAYTFTVKGKEHYKDEVSAEYKITPAPLTLTSADLTKEYDGDTLTNADAADLGADVNENGLLAEDGWAAGEGASYTFTGSCTLPGEQATNAFTISANEGTNLTNYTISKTEGTLSITDRTEPFEVSVTANSGGGEYNGSSYAVSGFEGEVEGKGVPVQANGKTYYVSGLVSEASGTNVADSVEAIPVTGTAKVEDADENDVTAQFHIDITKGSLVIAPAALTLASADLTKEYDGTALTNADAPSLGVLVNERGLLTEEGWKNSDGASYVFTGSAALPDEHAANTFIINANAGTLLSNYAIDKTEGQLMITDRSEKLAVTLTGNSYTGIYDNKEHTVSGFVGDVEGKGTAVKVNGRTYYVTGFTSEASGKDVSDSIAAIPVKVTGSFKVEDENGSDVTSQFTVNLVSGSLTIKKASYKMTIKGLKPTVKFAKLKKKSQKIKRSKAITLKGTKGTVTYKKTSGSKKITVNKKNGSFTIKKGLKKATYKVKVKVTASGSANYSKQSKTVTVTVKVK